MAEADINSTTYMISGTSRHLINNKNVKPAEKTNALGEGHSGLNNGSFSERAVSQRY